MGAGRKMHEKRIRHQRDTEGRMLRVGDLGQDDGGIRLHVVAEAWRLTRITWRHDTIINLKIKRIDPSPHKDDIWLLTRSHAHAFVRPARLLEFAIVSAAPEQVHHGCGIPMKQRCQIVRAMPVRCRVPARQIGWIKLGDAGFSVLLDSVKVTCIL